MGIMTKEKQIATADELENELSGYIGTELWYRTPYGFLYTDGVRALAELAGAWWLIDMVGSYFPAINKAEELRYFCLITLDVAKDESAIFTVKADTDAPEQIRQDITYTDFPKGKFELFLCQGVLMLKSEY